MEKMKCSCSTEKGGVFRIGRFREGFVELGFETWHCVKMGRKVVEQTVVKVAKSRYDQSLVHFGKHKGFWEVDLFQSNENFKLHLVNSL